MIQSPLTASKDVSLYKTICSDQLIEGWKSNFNIDIVEELHGHKEIYLYQCNQTKLKFFEPIDIAGSNKLYEQLQKFDWFYMQDKWEYHTALHHLKKCKDVLEVGSAFGDFVKAGVEAGLNIRGIELNQAAVKVAQAKKLPVDCIDLNQFADLYPESLDAICSFQVLEHVANPKEFIRLSLKTLKPRGKLIFCVPNSESFLKYQYNLLDMPPHHMLQWSETSLRALEQIFPIKVEKIIYEPLASYHISGYISAYSEKFKSFSKFSKIIFNHYTVPIFETLLKSGLRKFFRGQSIYIQFHKL